MKKQYMLMILDGFGLREETEGNAIKLAKTPNLNRIFKEYPNTTLSASGLMVGLPEGQMGNSEVGHLNMGAGRIVYQELTRITKEIEEGGFNKNEAILGAISNAKKNDSALHIMGLLSDGGVHSHIDHIKACMDLAVHEGLNKVYLHAFTDGRDVPPTSGISYMEEINKYAESLSNSSQKVSIGVVSGRYYAMDRDKRWERVELAYDALTLGKGREADCPLEAVKFAYENGETDEFIIPTVCNKNAVIKDNDSVIFCNFRPDRAREITRALVDPGFDGFKRKVFPKDLFYVTMTEYDPTIPNVHVAFSPERIENTLGEYVSKLGLKQLRIAETEKYAHVTFFFNGGVEEPNPSEDRNLIPSPKVPTYDLKPEMSAYEVTDKVLEALDSKKYDLIILNFANCDMVGHTGNLEAAIKAVEAVDICVGKIEEKMLSLGGEILLTADHGNADVMIAEDGSQMTAHSVNPVPLIYIADSKRDLKDGGKLADIAPTLLDIMKLEKPQEMTGRSLLEG